MHVLVRAALAVGLLAPITTIPDARAERATTPDEEVLLLVNEYRRQAGLKPVQLDDKLSKGCTEHAQYMKLNRGTPAMQGLNAHKQDPALPGATPAGAACGKAADLFPGVADLKTAVHGWMASLYHRRPMLSPALERIGVGYAPLADKTLMAALMFVDAKNAADKPGWPVAYPTNDLKNVPLEFGNEIPNPIPNNGSGGYPFTLQFPAFDKVTAVTATLVDAAGRSVPFYLSTPEKPATSFGQYGVICVIPKAPLEPDTKYVATIKATWRGEAKTYTHAWQTIALRVVDAADEAALVAAIGSPSLVTGTVQWGGMMNTKTAYLAVAAAAKHGRWEMVSVIVPLAVWNQISKGKPESAKGMTVAVKATPQLVQNRYLNLPISTPAQLKLTKP